MGANSVIKEFRYVNGEGNLISNGCHSAVLEKLVLDNKSQNTPFFDNSVYDTFLFNKSVSVVVLSTIIDAMLGEYEDRDTHERIVFGEWKYDATLSQNWDVFLNQKCFNGYTTLCKDDYAIFSDKYIGRESADVISDRYVKLVNALGKIKICLILGPEKEAQRECCESLIGAHLFYQELNTMIKTKLRDKENVRYIEITELIQKDDDFTNSINHYSRDVYYRMAKKIEEYYPEYLNGETQKVRGNINLVINRLKNGVSRRIKKFLNNKF